MQRSFLDEKLINEETYASAVAEINRQNNDRLTNIQTAYKTASLAMFADMTMQTVGMLDMMGKEGSAAYKALFLASKAAAIAQAIVNTEEAATKALTMGPVLGIPMSTLVRVTGYASVASIAAQTIVGMAHDGIDAVPQTGTWLLEKGERVMTAQTSARLDSTLDRIDVNGNRGGQPIINLIEDRSRAGQVETETTDREEIINIFVADIRGNGRMAQAMEATYPIRRVGR
ncbi:hypothetical protein V8Z80_04880 [Orrella sp. JC864]|uniref:hypothetical protein n=1 Tax=Orrella sp. JC864 TaxID=3120298 RepID=UPI003008D686